MRTEVDRFTVGGTMAGASLPGKVIQQALGSTIEIDIIGHRLFVPTPTGTKVATKGNCVVAYNDGTFEVEKCD